MVRRHTCCRLGNQSVGEGAAHRRSQGRSAQRDRRADAAGHGHDEFAAQLVGDRERLRCIGIAHDLDEAFAIAQVDENDAAVIAAPVHPAVQRDGVSEMGTAHAAAIFATHRSRSSKWKAGAGRLTVYCPDAIDLESFYNKSIHPADRMRTHNAYENVIVHDVFDFARRECNCHRVAMSGASLGAYHAANIAFRHPDTVNVLISLSGSFDISDFFNGYRDDNVYFNSPYEYLPNMTDPWKYNHMRIIIGTGEWDNTRHESFRLSDPKLERHFPLARRP